MNKKLLVIEDDPGLRSQLKWCFEGFEVLQAEDMETATRQLEKHNPPVATLDLGLPPGNWKSIIPRLPLWTWAYPRIPAGSRLDFPSWKK
jgi:DNA-binding response OmpR family regulator